ncbi:glycosyltransferase [Leucobacter sp. M11]|uniref:glycosyltransferase n=1 Tax=Leucobacter sp. M11 TaxID=2993565 RepID=UPI002D8027BB|nr:glycosyltransferase [Leucobacter sp. M11]MEB4614875.1 glycosyltransferase [Leucobacter sp. M11]
MRIALVSLHTSPVHTPGSGDAGGMNVVVAETAAALVALGHEVDILTRRTHPAEAALRRMDSGALLRVIDAGEPDLAKAALPSVAQEFGRAVAALPRFDVVHAHYWLSGLAAAPAAAAHGAALAITLHTVGAQKNARLAPGDTPEPEARLRAERELVHRAIPIAVSSSEAAAISAGYDVPRDRIAVITPGVDTERFRPEAATGFAATLGEPGATRDWLALLGRVQPLKGQDLAIRALAEARRLLGEAHPLGLVLAGEATPEHAAYARGLANLVAELDLVEHVRFLPGQARAGAAALLAGARLTLMPSHSETFGLVALESAASGTPVLAPAHTGFRESVADGVSGRLLPDRDPVRWGAAIAELLGDPSGLAHLSRSARSHALGHRWLDSAHALLGRYASATR